MRVADAVILVPAYEPGDGLPGYAAALSEAGFGRIVVVDDGSGEKYRPVFAALEAMPCCTVLRHEENRGKGAALKTGLAWIRENFPDVPGVVTADSDGQHAVEDCLKLAEELESGEETVLLGGRDFSGPSVPFRSWWGNRWATVTFWMVHGKWLSDTQTGLRAFPAPMIRFMLGVEGERFEYEMAVLIACARRGIAVKTIPIRTIYENGNAGTHFRPLADTLRINRLVFADFFRFVGVSIASFLLDQGLAWLFAAALAACGTERFGVIWASGFAARVLSSAFNYTMNRKCVFRSKGPVFASAWRYALLCAVVIAASNAGVTLFAFAGVPRGAAKLVCDIVLCLAGYRIQSALVFK